MLTELMATSLIGVIAFGGGFLYYRQNVVHIVEKYEPSIISISPSLQDADELNINQNDKSLIDRSEIIYDFDKKLE